MAQSSDQMPPNPPERIVAVLCGSCDGIDQYLGSMLSYQQRICMVRLSQDWKGAESIGATVMDRRFNGTFIGNVYRIELDGGEQLILEGPMTSEWFGYNYPDTNWPDFHRAFIDAMGDLEGVARQRGVESDQFLIWFYSVSNRSWGELTGE